MSFEHDIVFNPNWIEVLIKHMQSDPELKWFKEQDLSLIKSSKKIEEVNLEKVPWYTRIDNNFY